MCKFTKDKDSQGEVTRSTVSIAFYREQFHWNVFHNLKLHKIFL